MINYNNLNKDLMYEKKEKNVFFLNIIPFVLKIQQRELEDYRQKRDILSVDLNIALEENEVCNFKKVSKISFCDFSGSFRSNKTPRKTIRNVSSKINSFLHSHIFNFSIRIEIQHLNKLLIIKI